MVNPNTQSFLNWCADRLVRLGGESENVDFIRRLRHEAAKAGALSINLSINTETYQLFATDEIFMDGSRTYLLQRRGMPGKLGSKLILTEQQAADLSRQLDAGVDYYND